MHYNTFSKQAYRSPCDRPSNSYLRYSQTLSIRLDAGGLLVGYRSQTMAVGRESRVATGLGLARLKLWSVFSYFLQPPPKGINSEC